MYNYINNFKENKEAIKMKVFILHSMMTLYDENDSIWREIIRRTKRLDELRRFPEFENIPIEAPFLQGDITGNESGLPDVIYESKRYVLGIEHFEFDSSCQTRKGSKMKQDSFKAETELDKLQRTIQSRPSKIEINVTTDFSYRHYLKSLFSTFKSHIEKVDKYKRALKKEFPGKTVLIAFFIEDSTELGNYVITPNGTKGLNPLYLKLVILFLLKHLEIDYVISAFQDPVYVSNIYIQKIDEKNLIKLYENSYTDKDRFLAFKYSKMRSLH